MMIMPLIVSVAAANNDFDAVTNHIDIAPEKELAILYPTKDIQTTAAGYQLTGTSNPDQELTVNGETVEGRGANGTFAVYVSLKNGANTFTFRQADNAATITVTKGDKNSPSTAVTNLEELPKPLPQYDLAIKSGKTFTFKYYAPSATTVSATIDGKMYNLTKNGSYFTGSYTIPEVEGTVELGTVEYTITGSNGTSAETTQGSLFAVGREDNLQIQVKSVSTTIFKEASLNSTFIATAKQGAVDRVVDYDGDMYKLATGGWIMAKTVKPLTTGVKLKNEVESVTFDTNNYGELFTFHGTSHPMYRVNHTSSALSITFCNTTGIGDINVSESTLFSNAAISEKDGHTAITLTQSSVDSLWGYLIEYKDGQTTLLCKYRPKLSGDSDKPLNGVTIAVDAGHGGGDPGALGITYGHGTTEKDINLATAVALQKKLELLGAEVIMLREDDATLDLNSRMAAAQAERVDFLISLHSNSVGFSSTASKANGVEVYYYDSISKALAQNITAGISGTTGRKSRGAKYSNFVMTLNSYAPSVLVEMGFLLNPSDFDSMCSKQGIYNTVTAISDNIIASLS